MYGQYPSSFQPSKASHRKKLVTDPYKMGPYQFQMGL